MTYRTCYSYNKWLVPCFDGHWCFGGHLGSQFEYYWIGWHITMVTVIWSVQLQDFRHKNQPDMTSRTCYISCTLFWWPSWTPSWIYQNAQWCQSGISRICDLWVSKMSKPLRHFLRQKLRGYLNGIQTSVGIAKLKVGRESNDNRWNISHVNAP